MRLPRRKWPLLLAFWTVQAAVLIVFHAFMWGQSGWIGGSQPRLWVWPGVSDMLDVFRSWEGVVTCVALAVVPPMLQSVLVLPFRFDRPRRKRGVAVYFSLSVAAIGLGVLVSGAVGAAASVIVNYLPSGIDEDHVLIVMLASLGVSWAGCTTLLVTYVHATDKPSEAVIARVARVLFRGSVVEFVALIPLDVMVRRKTSCYCGEGTFFALLGVGSVVLIAAGPAALLPLLAKRKAFRHGRACQWCGYDMRGTPEASVCPECGRPWRFTASS
ncbi:MAG: hypothetical protein AMXMBFR77_27130 [Phycisphaerales bacterium]|nr:hypothetical protein [Leptolyngbya sp.]MCZ7634281.1 hypothetical protein [Phycisphaerales bacterium]MDL1905763.1 hypothetical protein [Synechococcales cyanobacterium CNB]GIK20533.1 MAG: hypothetical protein BroJett004_26970 [Planctomycetota bacterium]